MNRPELDDTIQPDYKIKWKNIHSLESVVCRVFTYENKGSMALTSFATLDPDCQIDEVKELQKMNFK